MPSARTTGMVLGKFLPPHAGHQYLVEFARAFVDELTVVVGTLAREPIPGELRYAWMRELFPGARVVHLTDELPQDPSEHPQFWDLWRTALERVLPGRPDYVFASEPYGARLAAELGARFIPVDLPRSAVPTSGTAVRNAPLARWEDLPPCVRPYFVRRVCVFGPESTGKSTLARHLAAEFQTVAVPEYARAWLEQQAGQLTADDIPIIARGQLAAEAALARQSNRVLICDTDVLLTTIWSDWLFGACPAWIRAAADEQRYDLYLLCDVDVPWVGDPVRYLPAERETFFARCQQALVDRGRPFVRIAGDWETRFQTARGAVARLLE